MAKKTSEKNNCGLSEEQFKRVEKAIADIKNGKLVMVLDDESRENEGDLICACEFATPQNINFMAANAKGLICMPCSKEHAKKMNLDPMTFTNTDNHETAFTVSVDHKDTTTGISAYDRSTTAVKFASAKSKPQDFRRPGHMFPLVAKDGGTLVRNGHTEATVDLCVLAGLQPCGLCCEIMAENGKMARLDELKSMAKKWNMTLIHIEELIEYRKATEKHVICVAKANLPTKYGNFKIYGYQNTTTGEHHEVLVMGSVKNEQSVLTRIHSECVTGDTFGSLKCDCGQQLELALSKIAENKSGVLLYLRQEGRGIGILNKIKAYALQEKGLDTVDANLALGLEEDSREYYTAAWILQDLGITGVDLMTNNPKKIEGIEFYGSPVHVEKRIALQIKPQKYDQFYLATKAMRMGHLLAE